MGKGEWGVLAQRAWDTQRGHGLLVTAPSATHLSLCPMVGITHTNPIATPTHVPPVCPLFDPPQPHPCVPSVSPGPICVPGVFSSFVPPCVPSVLVSCPCVPLMSHLCPLHGPTHVSPCVPTRVVPPMCHPCILFVSPLYLFHVPRVPPSLCSPTHVSHPCVRLPSVPPVRPHIPPMCPLRVSHLCFSFARPLQSLPVSHPCVPLESSL